VATTPAATPVAMTGTVATAQLAPITFLGF
jgi:hypothetical protein